MIATQDDLSVATDTGMRILKIGTCSSLSGISEISFMVGCPIDSPNIADISLRISGNTSSGKWNKDWIRISNIDHLLSKLPKDQGFTAAAFHPLYPNASSNSPGFLACICLHLKLLARVPNGRAYARHSGEMFWAEIEKALATGVNLVPLPIGDTAGNSGSDTVKVKPGKKSKAVTTANA